MDALDAAAVSNSDAASATVACSEQRVSRDTWKGKAVIVVSGRPPNHAAILARFPQANRPGTIFAYGDRVYIIGSTDLLTPALRAHEAVHLQRQADYISPDLWWDRYLIDNQFILDEELPAHRAEYGVLRQTVKDRNVLALHFTAIADRLASPLYGNIVTQTQARQLLLRGLV